MPELQSDSNAVSQFLQNYLAAQPTVPNLAPQAPPSTPFAMQPAPAPSNPLFQALSQQSNAPAPAPAPTPAPAAAADVPDAPAATPKIVAPGNVAPAIKVPFPTPGQTQADKDAAEANQRVIAHNATKPGLYGLWDRESNIQNPFLKALARVGTAGLFGLNAAGSVYAPEVEAQIPGTPLHWKEEGQQLENQAGDAQKAATAATKNIADQSKADTDAAAANTPDYGTFEVVQTSNGLSSFSSKGPNANTLTPLVDKDGKRIQPPVKGGNPDFHVLANGDYGTAVSDPKTGAVSFQVLGHTDPKVETDQTEVIGSDGKPHKILVNKATGAPIRDLGEAFVKPSEKDPLAHEMAEDRLGDTEIKTLSAKWQKRQDGIDAQVQKVGDTLGDLDPKNGAIGQALGVPKLLTALVSGAGSGVRITQAELNTIGRARGINGDVQNYFEKMASGKTLTAGQVHQMQLVLRDVREKLFEKRDAVQETMSNIVGAQDRGSRYDADQAGEKKWSGILKDQSGANGPVVFNVPGLGPHTFPNQAALDGYKKEKGIK